VNETYIKAKFIYRVSRVKIHTCKFIYNPKMLLTIKINLTNNWKYLRNKIAKYINQNVLHDTKDRRKTSFKTLSKLALKRVHTIQCRSITHLTIDRRIGWTRNKYEDRLKGLWTGGSAPLLCRGIHNSITAPHCRQSTNFSNGPLVAPPS
jgi:hypothetical protein